MGMEGNVKEGNWGEGEEKVREGRQEWMRVKRMEGEERE